MTRLLETKDKEKLSYLYRITVRLISHIHSSHFGKTMVPGPQQKHSVCSNNNILVPFTSKSISTHFSSATVHSSLGKWDTWRSSNSGRSMNISTFFSNFLVMSILTPKWCKRQELLEEEKHIWFYILHLYAEQQWLKPQLFVWTKISDGEFVFKYHECLGDVTKVIEKQRLHTRTKRDGPYA